MKKITQEWSNCLISVKQVMGANTTIEKTENDENTGVEPVAGPNKLKMMLWTNTKDGK